MLFPYSLLSPDVLNGTPEDLGIGADLDEPVYEIPDFNRSSKLRHSEQTFNRKTTLNNSKLISNNIRVAPPPLTSLPVSHQHQNDFFNIEKAPHISEYKIWLAFFLYYIQSHKNL